jgi:hypothetical protein
MQNAIVGVYGNYIDAQRVRHDLIVSGYSSAEVEVASSDELQSEYGIHDSLPVHSYAVLLLTSSQPVG